MYKSTSRSLQWRSVHSKDSPSRRHGIPRFLKQAYKLKTPIEGRICSEVKGGVTVTFNGYRAFCPHTEMYPRYPSSATLLELQIQPLEFLIVRIKLNSVIVSRIRAVQEKTWINIYQSLSDGIEIPGIVKKIESYGVFVDLGAVDGLLHISKIKNSCKKDINSFLKIGQDISVVVWNIDDEKRISLSLKSE